MQDRAVGIGQVCCILEDEDPEYECIQVDVDQDDASFCPVHGSRSELAQLELEREADVLAAYYSGPDPFGEEATAPKPPKTTLSS